MKISKRFVDRAKPALKKYQKLLADAKSRDVNESDTCVILADFLADVLGYDKYAQVTTEFAVRSTFCDLAVKVGGHVKFLIEVKSIGTDLKENHLNQVIAYAAQHGTDWVLLTNGVVWRAYRMKFEQPITAELCFDIDLLDANAKSVDTLQKLYLISHEAVGASAIDQFWNRRQATSRFTIAQVVLSEPTLKLVRRILRSQCAGLQITEDEVAALLREEVIKRDVLEGDKADQASRTLRRRQRRKEKSAAGVNPAITAPPPA